MFLGLLVMGYKLLVVSYKLNVRMRRSPTDGGQELAVGNSVVVGNLSSLLQTVVGYKLESTPNARVAFVGL